MITICFIIVAAAVVFIAGAIGCFVGELMLKIFKQFFK